MEAAKTFEAFNYFIFDLDNTLYNEEDFLFFAYYKIGKYVWAKNNIEPETVSDYLTDEFRKQGRDNIFQKLNKRFSLNINVAEYLNILRNSIAEDIALYDIYYKIFEQLKSRNSKIYIITNGTPVQQQNKIKSINWKGFDKNIKFYFANEYAPKPEAEALNKIIRENNLDRYKTLFIGDSQTDFDCALNAGVSFMYNYQFEKLWK